MGGTWKRSIGLASAGALALALSGCHQKPIVGPVLILNPSATLPHQVGHFDAAESAMVAMPGEKGYVAFGPYAELPPGPYKVIFDLSVEGSEDAAGQVDVNAFTAAKPNDVIAGVGLRSGAGQKVALDFTATIGSTYEFRVTTAGNATIKLLGIVVKRRS